MGFKWPSLRDILVVVAVGTLLCIALYMRSSATVFFDADEKDYEGNSAERNSLMLSSINLTASDFYFDNTKYEDTYLRTLWEYELPGKAWFSDEKCAIFVTRFTRFDQTSPVWLSSFPRSGNTWTRYLIEAASGVLTSSGSPKFETIQKLMVKEEKAKYVTTWKKLFKQKMFGSKSELQQLGYFGESAPWILHNTVVHKTHADPEFWNHNQSGILSASKLVPFETGYQRRAIILIRDPFKALISLKKYGDNHSVLAAHVNITTNEFVGAEWEQYVLFHSRHWYRLNMAWVERTNESLVIPYELLKNNPMEELQYMLNFIKVVPDPQRLQCLEKHLEGVAHNRNHDILPDEHIYPLNIRAYVWALIHQLNVNLQDRGHPALPLFQYSFAAEFATGVIA